MIVPLCDCEKARTLGKAIDYSDKTSHNKYVTIVLDEKCFFCGHYISWKNLDSKKVSKNISYVELPINGE